CVGFDGGSITGEQILQASGVEYATSSYGSMGDAVCQIDEEPSSYPPGCWTSSSPYWAMFVSRAGGGWSVSSRGVSSQTFADGDAEGFRYDSQSGAPAQPASPAGVCAPAQAGAGSSTFSQPGSNSGRAPGGTSATAPHSPVAPAQTSAPGAANASPSVAAGVVGRATPSPGQSLATASAAGSAGPNAGLLAASAVGGALVGLLVVQLARRRRRA
ncbi:MAG: hypothetical protein ABR498_09530, partial [Candidatus Dormibacteria bacterium]